MMRLRGYGDAIIGADRGGVRSVAYMDVAQPQLTGPAIRE